MELNQVADKLVKVFDATGDIWEEYGPPTEDDLAVTVAAMIDYLDGVEGPTQIHIPNSHVKVTRDEAGDHVVWFEIGKVDIDLSDDDTS